MTYKARLVIKGFMQRNSIDLIKGIDLTESLLLSASTLFHQPLDVDSKQRLHKELELMSFKALDVFFGLI